MTEGGPLELRPSNVPSVDAEDVSSLLDVKLMAWLEKGGWQE